MIDDRLFTEQNIIICCEEVKQFIIISGLVLCPIHLLMYSHINIYKAVNIFTHFIIKL